MSPLYIYLRVVLGWLSIETLEEIQDFSRWMLIAVFIITVERSFRTYLSIHREYTIPTYCAVISYFLHPLWLYLLCDLADMRLKGIAIAMAITELFILVSSFIIATAMSKLFPSTLCIHKWMIVYREVSKNMVRVLEIGAFWMVGLHEVRIFSGCFFLHRVVLIWSADSHHRNPQRQRLDGCTFRTSFPHSLLLHDCKLFEYIDRSMLIHTFLHAGFSLWVWTRRLELIWVTQLAPGRCGYRRIL